jgi:CP family cyanate transporter-like MFS transporter
VLLGATGSYAGMFVLVLAGVLVLGVTGWFMTRERYADDEVNRFVPGWSSTAHCEDVLEVAGTEAPVSVHVTQTDDGSPRG